MKKTISICAVFNQHKDEIYALCQSKSQFPLLQAKIEQLLDSPELKTNVDVPKAKNVFKSAKNVYNRYISLITTYMTCIAVGKNY